MKNILMMLMAIVVIGAGGAVFLAHQDIKPPQHTVEKVLSNERFIQ